MQFPDVRDPKKKAVHVNGPKSREETPKEGDDRQALLANVAMHNLGCSAQITIAKTALQTRLEWDAVLLILKNITI